MHASHSREENPKPSPPQGQAGQRLLDYLWEPLSYLKLLFRKTTTKA